MADRFSYRFCHPNQLVASTTPDGKVTKYAYDAAGRMVKEGKRTYRYGHLDKVLSVKEGKNHITYGYHVDGQLATVTKGKVAENFTWDGLALVKRGTTSYVNEPHPGGGAPVASSDGGVMFNDILGTTLGVSTNDSYASSSMTAFGDVVDSEGAIAGAGHSAWIIGDDENGYTVYDYQANGLSGSGVSGSSSDMETSNG